ARYTWTAATAASGAQTVTAYSNAGATSTATFTVAGDTAAPTANTPGVTAGYHTTAFVSVGGLGGSDGGSGVDLASGVLERASATLTDGSCGSFGAFTQVAAGGSSYTDASVA